jgi:hypothetical protein
MNHHLHRAVAQARVADVDRSAAGRSIPARRHATEAVVVSGFTVIRRAAVASLCCAIVLCALSAVASADGRPPARTAAAQPQHYVTTASGIVPLHSLAPQHQTEGYYASYGDVEQLPLTRAEATGGMAGWMLGALIVAAVALLVPVVTGARLVRRRRRVAVPA